MADNILNDVRRLYIKNYNLCGSLKIIEVSNNRQFLFIHEIIPNEDNIGKCLINYNYKLILPKLDIQIQLGSSDTIELVPRVVGGLDLSMDDIIDSVMSELNPIVEPIRGIANVFILLFKIILGAFKLLVWLIQFFLWFLVDFCNPLNLATDFVGGITKITRLLFAAASDALFGALKYFFNMFLEPIFSGFWGWDNALTKEEKQKIYTDALNEQMKNTGGTGDGSGLVQSGCHGPGVKCYRTPDGHVPFTVVLATVLLPPMGVFMEFGLTNWINIVICAILTMVYYIPGLTYALVLIYS
jgi:uncharacterized membrane protein YqaE (UPF0057 family)